jgi:predicted TIM-barrel fold metal-dependent hydrolase
MLSRRSLLAAPALLAQDKPAWDVPVIDIHLHWRQDLRLSRDANLVHMDGCGVSRAVLLTRSQAADSTATLVDQYPQHFVWSVSADITKPGVEALFTQAVKRGARAFGELKFHVAADGPELRRAYALAAELDVPVLVHFQEVDHFPGEGKWSTGFKNFASVLKAFPKTKFVGHADAFWANLSADYHDEIDYPTGPIKPGGITDKLLADFPNLYGDLSANSGNNGLSRDPEFTHAFLRRHQNKLMFGSDCPCTDGRGANTERAAKRLQGKCVARETLSLLHHHLKGSPTLRKITWENAHLLYRILS